MRRTAIALEHLVRRFCGRLRLLGRLEQRVKLGNLAFATSRRLVPARKKSRPAFGRFSPDYFTR